jgi:SOS-response transcriptional repressor LexA
MKAFSMDLSGCGASEAFVLQVQDDSMEPEFNKGCIIVIDPDGVVTHGAYVIALVENGYIFRQWIQENQQFYIQPLNEAYAHEKRLIELSAVKGVVVQRAGARGRRAERKHY